MKIAIEARLRHGAGGGVEQVLVGLAHGLAQIHAPDLEFTFVGRGPLSSSWLSSHLGPGCRIHYTMSERDDRRKQYVSAAYSAVDSKLVASARSAIRDFRDNVVRGRGVLIRQSDGAIEATGADLCHFPFQAASLTDLPSLYHPHDLQHIHLPDLWPHDAALQRDVEYRAHCARATLVPVASTWTREDLIRQYNLPPDKVVVVPLAPPVAAYDHGSPVKPDGFPFVGEWFLFPAHTWIHKNHLRLLEALALIRSRTGRNIQVAFTGAQTPHFANIKDRVRELELGANVWFGGFRTPQEMVWLYKNCLGLVMPSLFEAASFPVWEAFAMAKPVVASNVTALPEQIGDAGITFDPLDVDAIAEGVLRLAQDPGLRNVLGQRGHERVARFSWKRTAGTFVAHYRRLGGLRLNDEDRAYLGAEHGI